MPLGHQVADIDEFCTSSSSSDADVPVRIRKVSAFLKLLQASKVQNDAEGDAKTSESHGCWGDMRLMVMLEESDRTSDEPRPDTKDTPRELPKEIVKDTPTNAPQDSPEGVIKENNPEDAPKPRPIARNRRWNRIGKVASHYSKSKTTEKETITPEQEKLLPWAPELLSRRVPRNLRNLPYLIVGSSPEEFGDAFIFPLSVPGTNHVLGCLAISRAWFESEGLREDRLSNGRFGQVLSTIRFIDVFPLGKDPLSRDAEKPRPDADYWAKFSQE